MQVLKQIWSFVLAAGLFPTSGELSLAGDEQVGLTLNGDVNGDKTIDISDPVYLLGSLFTGGPAPVGCQGERLDTVRNGNVNGDKEIDISDGIYLLNFLFLSGRRPRP